MTALAGWQNFYVIVGSSAGALIGLQFVVLTLIAERPITGANIAQAGAAFSTPTVVHFATALLLAAMLCAPWNGLAGAATAWGFVGLCGLVYAITVTRRMRAQTIYRPVFEDWLFHVLLPFSAYATLVATAYEARSHAREALFAVAAAALLLLFIGIHNAWDGITYHLFNRKPLEDRPER
jgi:hypothetical protein